MSQKTTQFIPAFKFHALTSLYDPITRIFFGKTYQRIVKSIPVHGAAQILDVGCGPGTMLLNLKKTYPHTQLTGLDIDPKILRIAHHKLQKYQDIKLVEASATTIPLNSQTFDIVTSSFAFHHLTTLQKEKTIHEIYRLLKPGGTFWLFDFAKPQTTFGKFFAAIYTYLEEIEDGIKNKIPSMMQKAEFKNIKTHWSILGTISLISAEK